MIKKKCLKCGKEFVQKHKQIKLYCTIKCYRKYRLVNENEKIRTGRLQKMERFFKEPSPELRVKKEEIFLTKKKVKIKSKRVMHDKNLRIKKEELYRR